MKESKSDPIFGRFIPKCSNRLMFPINEDYYIYLTIIGDIAPSIMLAIGESVSAYEHGLLVFIVLNCFFAILTTYYTFRTWLTEPGILPRSITPKKPLDTKFDAQTKYLSTLFQYVRRDNLKAIQEALIKDPSIINSQNNEKRTLLHIAIITNKDNICCYLIDHGADVNIKDMYQLSPLHYSAYQKNDGIFEYILQKQNQNENLNAVKDQVRAEVVGILGEDLTHFGGSGVIPDGEYVTKQILDQNQIKAVISCKICNVYVPPRAYHCRYCDICIRRYDHHCPYMANCIGLRNHRFFYLFLITQFLMLIFGFICSLWILIDDIVYAMTNYTEPNMVIQYGLRQHICGFIYIIYSFLIIFSISPLLYYHTIYISKNITTLEDVTSRYDHEISPYSKGFWMNWYEEFFTPVPESLAIAYLQEKEEEIQEHQNEEIQIEIHPNSPSSSYSLPIKSPEQNTSKTESPSYAMKVITTTPNEKEIHSEVFQDPNKLNSS